MAASSLPAPSAPVAATPAEVRRLRRRRAERLAAGQAGIVSLRQLYALGLTRAEVTANVRARRWRRVGRQSICVHCGPLSQSARHWVAVQQAGPRAYLDGGSALVEAGVQQLTMPAIRVSVPRGARVWPVRGLDIRQTRRWDPDDRAAGGPPRSRPPVAAVRAALWARTDREASYLLSLPAQQGICSAEDLAHEAVRVRRDRRRALVHQVVLDLLGGVRSLGELELARECRRRGLPEPSRQVVRRTRNGTYYLDMLWEEWGLVVEVDGIQHSWVDQVVGDAIRQNAVTLQNATVLRLPLLGLRVAPDEFFAQIEQALLAAGCDPVGRRTA